jgi:hypothetical protein
VKVPEPSKEACELAKAGFEYLTEIEGAKSSENADEK